MSKFTAKVISKGRVTIPETIRELLDISEGDFVDIELKKLETSKID